MKLNPFSGCVLLFAMPGLAQSADYQVPAPLPTPSFSGYYFAGGVGYGVSDQRDFTMSRVLPSPCCNFFNVDGSFIMPEGWFGTTVAGYNAQIGGFLAGTEFSARFGNEGGSRTLLTNQSTAFGVTGQINRSYEFRSDAGLHIAGRIGWVFDRTLVFSKFGVGISHTVDKFEFAGSGSFCVRPGPGEGCNESVAIGSAIVDVARWSPSVVWGAGLEHNFDRFFVRADAELEAVSDRNINDSASLSLGSSSPATVSGNASKAILTTRGSAKLGIRF